MRPCECEQIETCRLCWLFHNDERYRRLWEDKFVPPWERAFLLSLRRRRDRTGTALEECAKVGIEVEVFDALDGHAVPLPLFWESGPGSYGCLETHRRAIERAILDGNQSVLLLEDDVKFPDPENFQQKLLDFLYAVPPDWDCIYLGGQFMGPAVEVVPGVLKPTGPDGIHRSHAMILRGSYMHHVYSLYGSQMGHCDHLLGRTHEKFKVYAPSEWLAVQAEGTSDINGRTLGERSWTPKQILKTGQEPRLPGQLPRRVKPAGKVGCGSCNKKK